MAVLQGHKADWELLINGLKGAAHTADASTWEARAKTAEYELIKLCSTLLSLPDPTPLLGSTSALSAKILGKLLEHSGAGLDTGWGGRLTGSLCCSSRVDGRQQSQQQQHTTSGRHHHTICNVESIHNIQMCTTAGLSCGQ
jgi:hypothetical protein